MLVRVQEFLRFERRHAALPGGGDRLAVDLVGDVAGGEHAGHRGGGRIAVGDDVAGRLHLELAGEQFGGRRVADGDEHAVDRALGDRAGLDVLQPHAGDLERIVVADHVVEHAVPDHLDLGMLEQPLLHDLFGAEGVAPVHDRHLGGEIGEEQRLLDRGIAAADHHDFLVAVEEAVAGRAGRDAIALELLLRGQIEPARLRAGGDDQRVGEIDLAGVALQAERPLGQVGLADGVDHHLGADVLGLLLHLLHQPGTLDDVGKARIILDVGGDGQLAAGLDALDQDRLQHGARGIDRGGVAGRTRADDHDLGVGCLGH